MLSCKLAHFPSHLVNQAPCDEEHKSHLMFVNDINDIHERDLKVLFYHRKHSASSSALINEQVLRMYRFYTFAQELQFLFLFVFHQLIRTVCARDMRQA